MAMVVMVIVRPTFWKRDLINVYATINKFSRSRQVACSAGSNPPCGIAMLARLISLDVTTCHNRPWPGSLSRQSACPKMVYRSAGPGGVAVKSAVAFAFLISFLSGACVPAASAGDQPDRPRVLIFNALQIHEIQQRAQAGDSEAQYILGSAYRTGGPILAKDMNATVQWWRKAAAQGHARAQNDLGYLYQKGEGVPLDYAEAAKWYRMAAAQGDATAQDNLGSLYFSGRGVRRSYKAAFAWVAMAARQGLAAAQHDLAIMYRYGKGTGRNLSAAVNFFTQAARQGLPQAQNELGAMYLRGDGVSRDPAEAFRWFQLAAEQSLPDAENNVGYLYSTGQGTGRNYREACRWFQRAAEQGVVAAEVNLGALYMNGRGVPLDYVEGYMWLSLAAAQGSKPAAMAKKNLTAIMTPRQLGAAETRLAEWRQQHAQDPTANR